MDLLALLSSMLWPPTTLTGLVVWVATAVTSYLYMIKRRSERYGGNAAIRVDLLDFAFRTFATAVSLSVLAVGISQIKWGSQLGGPGTGQFYITFGLICSVLLLASNLKGRLDSFLKETWEPPEKPEITPTRQAGVFKAEILERKIFHAGDRIRFRASYKGELVKGFVTAEVNSPERMVLPDSRVPYVWWPAYATISNDVGNLKGETNHEVTWDAEIPKTYPKGKYSVNLEVYDDLDSGRACLGRKTDFFEVG